MGTFKTFASAEYLHGVLLLLVVAAMATVAAAEQESARTHYSEFPPSDDEQPQGMLDYDDEERRGGVNKWDSLKSKTTREDDVDDNVAVANRYKSGPRYRSRYKNLQYQPSDSNKKLERSSTTTEQWNDDIEVEIKGRKFTKKNKVARTGSRSEFEKLNFPLKHTMHHFRQKSSLNYVGNFEADVDNVFKADHNQPETTEELEEEEEGSASEERARWRGRNDPGEDFSYYDVKRLHKIKMALLPFTQQRTERTSVSETTQQLMSPTSVAERELQAFLAGHRLRKEASSRAPRGEPSTALFTPAPPAAPGPEPRPTPVAHRRHLGHNIDLHAAAAGGTVGAAAPITHNHTFPPLAVDPAFEAQWNSFIADSSGDEARVQSILIFIFSCFNILLAKL